MSPKIEFPLVITRRFPRNAEVPYVALKKGEHEHWRNRLYAIIWWICKSDFDKIIVVDTTDDAALSESLTVLAQSCGKRLEYIAIQNDDESVARFGKGIGEGFALDARWKDLRYWENARDFSNVQGKIIVENYLDCVEQAKSKAVLFRCSPRPSNFVDSRFYFTSKAFWEANLRDAYKKVNDPRGVYLENAYYESIRKGSRNTL